MPKRKEILETTLAKYKQVVDAWFTNGFNGTEAYQSIYPNSSDNTAAVNFCDILRFTKVQDYIRERQDKSAEDANVTHTELVKNLKEIRDRCMQGVPVKDANGNPTGEWKFDPNAAIKAIENLGKHIGFYGVDNSQKKASGFIRRIDRDGNEVFEPVE